VYDAALLYLAAVLGSAAAEFATALRESSLIDGKCPARYKEPFYLAARAAFALLIAGPLPFVFEISTNLAAFYMGVTAQIIVDRLVKGHFPKPKGDSP
jgi:hypothetical protein